MLTSLSSVDPKPALPEHLGSGNCQHLMALQQVCKPGCISADLSAACVRTCWSDPDTAEASGMALCRRLADAHCSPPAATTRQAPCGVLHKGTTSTDSGVSMQMSAHLHRWRRQPPWQLQPCWNRRHGQLPVLSRPS